MKVGDLVTVGDGVGGFFTGIVIRLNSDFVVLHNGHKYYRHDCHVALESDSYDDYEDTVL